MKKREYPTQKSVQQLFTDNKCELLDIYKTCHIKLKFICSCGNHCAKTLPVFRKVPCCKKCGIAKRGDAIRKYCQEEVESYYEKHGCKLLDRFTSVEKRMKFICRCGNIGFRTYNSFMAGTTVCDECSFKKRSECHKRYSESQMQEEFDKHNCKILIKDNQRAHDRLEYICSCGNIAIKNFSQFIRCKTCPKCPPKNREHVYEKGSGPRKGGPGKYSIDAVAEFFNKNGATILSKHYSGVYEKLEFICKCGRNGYKNFAAFKIAPHCRQCTIERMSGRVGEKSPMWNPNRDDAARNKDFRIRCKNLVRRCLKPFGKKKINKTYALLGYSPADLIKHIESHPDWDSVKNEKWSIDHIFPVKAFMDYGILDIGLINSLDNLRPMILSKNMAKGRRYNKEDFENYLDTKGVLWKNQSEKKSD